MADSADKQDYRGVSSGLDMAKLPLYGQDDERLQELQKAQKEALDALQKRYDQPNWWKVAAGFAKPQLGGFLASAGSAAEAMGENVENQRAQQLPISQMKLALAQSNMLLGANKKVADQVKAWRDTHPNETPSAQQVGEWEAMAPGSSVVASLKNELKFKQEQQGVDVQAQQAQIASQQAAIAKANAKRAANIPLSAEDIAVLSAPTPSMTQKEKVPTVNNPNVAAPAQPSAEEKPKAETKSKNVYITPDGARVTEDLYKDFYKNGKASIPIISNLRSPEEQEALKDHQDANGKWYTKEGRPVSETSKHLTGDAIDLDPSKPLNKDQIGMLKSKGWNQTDPKNDPNHWERTPHAETEQPAPQAKPTASAESQKLNYPPTLAVPNTAGLGDADRQMIMEAHKKNVDATESPNVQTIQNYQPLVTGSNYGTISDNYNSALKLIHDNPKLSQQVFAMMRKYGMEAALNEGVGFHAGALNANVSLPIAAFKDAERREEVKAFADELFRKLAVLAAANAKSNGADLSKTPVTEYMSAMSQFANKNMTSMAAEHALNLSRAEFEHKKKVYDQVLKELPRVDTSKTQTPYTDIMQNSPELQKIHKVHAGVLSKYENDFNKRIQAARNKGNVEESKP